MKIAAAQIACLLGDLDANLGKVSDFVSRAKDAGNELIVFPEMCDTGYTIAAVQKHASSWNEGAVPRLEDIAKEFSINIVCGVSEREDECIYNSQVLIDARITEELAREGRAREVVRHVQNTRKDANLEMEDRIVLSLRTPSAALAQAIEMYGAYISNETLAISLTNEPLNGDVHRAEVKVDGHALVIELRKAPG